MEHVVSILIYNIIMHVYFNRKQTRAADRVNRRGRIKKKTIQFLQEGEVHSRQEVQYYRGKKAANSSRYVRAIEVSLVLVGIENVCVCTRRERKLKRPVLRASSVASVSVSFLRQQILTQVYAIFFFLFFLSIVLIFYINLITNRESLLL